MDILKQFARPEGFVTRLILSLLSIFLIFLSMPGSPLPLLTWIALVPVGLALINCKASQSSLLLFISATGWWLVAIWWLIPAVINFTNLALTYAVLILLVFSFILAAPYALIGWVIGYKQWTTKPYGVMLIAATYTSIHTWFPTALPGHHAHSLYQHPIFLQFLDIGGVPIILFFVVFVNWQIVKSIYYWLEDKRKAHHGIIRAASLLIIISAYGAYQLQQQEIIAAKSVNKKTIGFIQPLLERSDKLDRLYSMSRELVSERPDLDLVVWPEFPTAFSYIESGHDRSQVDQLIEAIEKPMVIVSGYVYETQPSKENRNPKYYNTAHLINHKRVLLKSYNKQVLAPFFEYLPFEDDITAIRDLFPDSLIYQAGNQATLFPLDADTNIIPLICYETIFPDVTRQFIDNGGNIIINLTNDIWFGESRGSSYHFALGLFRAIEHRVPWIRATNSGISAFVNAGGEIIEGTETPLMDRAIRTHTVSIPNDRSFYSTWGDLFLYLITAITITGVFFDKKILSALNSRSREIT